MPSANPVGRPRGQGKTPGSGRKKGSLNKKTLLRVDEVLERHGTHPIDEIIALMPELMPHERVRTWLELMKYLQPVLRPLEVDPKDYQPEVEPSPAESESTESLLALVQP